MPTQLTAVQAKSITLDSNGIESVLRDIERQAGLGHNSIIVNGLNRNAREHLKELGYYIDDIAHPYITISW